MPLFGAPFAAPNKGRAILSINSVKSYRKEQNSRSFQGIWVIFQYFSRHIQFSRTFQESSLNSSTFQACANPGYDGKIVESDPFSTNDHFCHMLTSFENCLDLDQVQNIWSGSTLIDAVGILKRFFFLEKILGKKSTKYKITYIILRLFLEVYMLHDIIILSISKLVSVAEMICYALGQSDITVAINIVSTARW